MIICLQACATNLHVDWKLPKGIKAKAISNERCTQAIPAGEHRIMYYEIEGDVSTRN